MLRKTIARALRVVLLFALASISGCASLYENEWFAADHVRVIHSEEPKRHCNDSKQSVQSEVPNANHILSMVRGIGRLAATKTVWEIEARQLAAELDADIALVRPCDGERLEFEYAQIEVWRTRGFRPIVREEYSSDSGALMAPSQSTYGSRLEDIFGCFEQARVTKGPISPDNKKRLGHVDATEFFSSGIYFPGYARVDNYFRPTRTGDLRLSMIYSDRARADWASNVYWELSSDEKQRFAERYLICLLDRGYSL
jgi:hypothetical protein